VPNIYLLFSYNALDNYFRFKLSRRSLVASIVTPARAEKPPQSKPTVQFVTSSAEEKKEPTSKPCSGHLGAQLGAVKSDGRKFKCSHPKDCTFKHVTVAGMPSQKLLELVASMPSGIRSDLTRAIEGRK
jgi:hypothetical protein